MKIKKLGYIIVNDNEEFLKKYCLKPYRIQSIWSLLCFDAQVFNTKNYAMKVINRLNSNCPLWALELYENEMHLIVTTEQENPPQWLNIL
jgi:hypothetical protein